MTYEAGSVVMLKSGGQPMTVVAASGDEIDCVWIGEEGEFFRHTIPAVALEAALSEDDEEHEEEDEEQEGEEVAEEDEEDRRRPSARPEHQPQGNMVARKHAGDLSGAID